MKKILFQTLFVACVISISIELAGLKAPETSYVCLPCGLACDAAVHTNPGTCPVCNMELVDRESIKFKNISFEQLCKRLASNKSLILLDVRSKEEFTNTHEEVKSFGKFKNAVNININELKDRVSELDKFKDKEVVVYCSHSHRSPQASYFLATHGFKNVENLSSGVSTMEVEGIDCLKDYFIPFPSKR